MVKNLERSTGGYYARLLFLLLIVSTVGVLWVARAETVQYLYDSLNRLIEVRYPDKIIRYTYDAAGNRTSVQVVSFNAAPSLSGLEPNSVIAGSGGFALIVNGSNFVNSSTVQWNGTNRPTTFVSDAQLRADIPASDIAAFGTANVTVVSPAPGGGTSNALTFTISNSTPTPSPTPTPTPIPTAGLQYYPLSTPIRLLDTRAEQPACEVPGTPLTGNSSRTQIARVTCDNITIPANAQAIVGNATVVNNTGAAGGFVTLYPSGAPLPTVSNLNYSPGEVVPNSFTVGLGADGAFNIYATSGINFIVDITGYYAPPGAGGLYYHPLPSPVRLLDTRTGQPACDAPGAPLIGGNSRTQNARLNCNNITIPSEAQAIVGNATVVNNTGAAGGFVTLYPSSATQPTVSNLNYSPEQIVPNSFTVGLGADGAFSIYATSGINFIVDVTGYYSDQAVDINGAGLFYHPLPSPVRLLDTRAGQPACDAPGTPLAGGGSRTQNARVTCSGVTIPTSAQVVVGNATVVNNVPGAAAGYITLHPSGTSLPTVSNLNYVPGQIVPNAFTVGLGNSDGSFNIFASSATHFIVDITGYYSDQASGVNGHDNLVTRLGK